LIELRDQIVARELLALVPTHLAGNEYHAPGRCVNSVGVPDGFEPTFGLQDVHGRYS